ncbi:putative disease resistance protein At3g14460 isoform X1 [Phragmites australis]|uniref:putative disease resistance protein At3g14460 isoform X1 n=1 Tax=Phragmites australis TaxID=29695 RepID=UPI002D78036C|nr:putative disease resistance protein At3g14460 isoform X1 [Phragmites australis]XP_062182621.1 putative disease resistance protein At3g14460 isoform X1 [Phragmites australis]
MLEKATKREKVKFSSPDMLETELKENLKVKRFFLVLDDFWRECVSDQQLDRLLSPLMVEKMGSKILVTTRFADAARALGAQNLIPMPEMDENQYSLMFMHYARISDQALSSEHELIGKKIAEKLGRSPLAARTVAGQLRGKYINYWKRTMNSDLLNNETWAALWWSYQQLEDHVKQCFTYCSMFPRRYRLRRDELVHLWVAQGFVDMEDIGHDCFDVLLSCSFIQPKGVGWHFTIHDLMHDLAKRVAGNDCFTFEKGMVDRIPQDVRHLCIESYDETVFREQVLKLKTLRTIFVSDWMATMAEKDWEKLLMNLKKLRVVQVPGWKGKIPNYIGELKHLRYLSFSRIGIETILPHTFCKLYHLQKFSASECKVDLSLVNETISNLVNLQYIDRVIGWDFRNIRRMTGLRTLGAFIARERRVMRYSSWSTWTTFMATYGSKDLKTLTARRKLSRPS